MRVTYEDVKRSEEIRTYITQADASLIALGYTEHSFAHVTRCAEVAGDLLAELGYDEHQIELCKIAAYMHDIGNVVNRHDHNVSGATMAFRILDNMGMEPEDVIVQVDGESVEELTMSDLTDRIKGEAGTQVSITVMRQGEAVTLYITRNQVDTEVTESNLINGTIGYVKIKNFVARSADETIAAV